MNGCRAAMNSTVSRNLGFVRSVKLLDGIGPNRPVESATAAPLYLNEDLAGVAGFEPATSRLTAERSAELNYTPAESYFSERNILVVRHGRFRRQLCRRKFAASNLVESLPRGTQKFPLKVLLVEGVEALVAAPFRNPQHLALLNELPNDLFVVREQAGLMQGELDEAVRLEHIPQLVGILERMNVCGVTILEHYHCQPIGDRFFDERRQRPPLDSRREVSAVTKSRLQSNGDAVASSICPATTEALGFPWVHWPPSLLRVWARPSEVWLILDRIVRILQDSARQPIHITLVSDACIHVLQLEVCG
jgi:hypothetical protein